LLVEEYGWSIGVDLGGQRRAIEAWAWTGRQSRETSGDHSASPWAKPSHSWPDLFLLALYGKTRRVRANAGCTTAYNTSAASAQVTLKKLRPGSYFGSSDLRHEFGGLLLAETSYPPGLVIPKHEHANPFLGLLLDGSFTQYCGRERWTGRSPALTVFPVGLPHANTWHELGGRILHVEFSPQWIKRLGNRLKVLEEPSHFEFGPPLWLSRRLVDEIRRNDDVSPLAIEGLVLELLAECARSPAETLPVRAPPWLKRVSELLQDRFREVLSLDGIAAEAGVSADHLARTFRRCHGCTMGEYVRHLRVDFACGRLTRDNTPLVEIALDAGFSDQSHFTKSFKRCMGITPAAFRNLNGARKRRTKR